MSCSQNFIKQLPINKPCAKQPSERKRKTQDEEGKFMYILLHLGVLDYVAKLIKSPSDVSNQDILAFLIKSYLQMLTHRYNIADKQYIGYNVLISITNSSFQNIFLCELVCIKCLYLKHFITKIASINNNKKHPQSYRVLFCSSYE